jgi:hypothetical protein
VSNVCLLGESSANQSGEFELVSKATKSIILAGVYFGSCDAIF